MYKTVSDCFYTILFDRVCLCSGVALGFGTLRSACTTIMTRNASHNRRPYAISTFFIFCDATKGFRPILLESFATATYVSIYYISSFITLLALPICVCSV